MSPDFLPGQAHLCLGGRNSGGMEQDGSTSCLTVFKVVVCCLLINQVFTFFLLTNGTGGGGRDGGGGQYSIW